MLWRDSQSFPTGLADIPLGFALQWDRPAGASAAHFLAFWPHCSQTRSFCACLGKGLGSISGWCPRGPNGCAAGRTVTNVTRELPGRGGGWPRSLPATSARFWEPPWAGSAQGASSARHQAPHVPSAPSFLFSARPPGMLEGCLSASPAASAGELGGCKWAQAGRWGWAAAGSSQLPPGLLAAVRTAAHGQGPSFGPSHFGVIFLQAR